MTELKSLTLKGTKYDSFIDETARAAIEELSGVDVNDPNRHEKYFLITEDGVISLKPEYRGNFPTTAYPDAVSDNGVGNIGSKLNELPENIIVPELVDEVAVVSLAVGMFCYNERVKSIVIPKCIRELPKGFARHAINLTNILGTDNIESIDTACFYETSLKKAAFPNLKALPEPGSQFCYCPLLTTIDIGQVVNIPKQAFTACEKLSYIYGGNNVVSVGDLAFKYTKRLKNLSFLSQLTSVGVDAFRFSRVQYDWASLTNCAFGENATVLQFNPNDWWSSCTYTACSNDLLSTLDQNDERWKNLTIGTTNITYVNGCNLVCAAMIYSAFENKPIESPLQFEEIVEEIDPTLMSLDVRRYPNIQQWLEAVGYTVEYKSTYNAENLQQMYNALANGALVLACIDNGANNDGTGHGVVIHGISASGEVLVQDPLTIGVTRLNLTEHVSYKAPIQNITIGTELYGFLIVSKN